jgi:hypothetical protein
MSGAMKDIMLMNKKPKNCIWINATIGEKRKKYIEGNCF